MNHRVKMSPAIRPVLRWRLPRVLCRTTPRNGSGDPYERRKQQQSHAVGSCAAADVTSSPCPPDRSNGHHCGQPTEEETNPNSAEPPARRTLRLRSHGHLPRLALDAESTNALKQPAGGPSCPDTGQPFMGFRSRLQQMRPQANGTKASWSWVRCSERTARRLSWWSRAKVCSTT